MLHAKPTFGDVIEVIPDDDGILEWDRRGVDFEDIDCRILEDSGRWVAIIEYWPIRADVSLESTFRALDVAAEKLEIVVEGAYTKKGRGCAYLAVPNSMGVEELTAWLRSQQETLGFRLRHPAEE
jgi:hypothetical protein